MYPPRYFWNLGNFISFKYFKIQKSGWINDLWILVRSFCTWCVKLPWSTETVFFKGFHSLYIFLKRHRLKKHWFGITANVRWCGIAEECICHCCLCLRPEAVALQCLWGWEVPRARHVSGTTQLRAQVTEMLNTCISSWAQQSLQVFCS